MALNKVEAVGESQEYGMGYATSFRARAWWRRPSLVGRPALSALSDASALFVGPEKRHLGPWIWM